MANSKLKKRADGLYQISVLIENNGEKKRKYFYGKTQQEAKKKMLAWQAKREAGRLFEDVASEWQKKHWKEIEAGTQVSYGPALCRAVNDLSGRPIREIAPLDIQHSLDAMAAQGYAQHSVSIYLCVLHQIFDHAILMQDLENNPAATVRVPKGLTSSTRECPSDEQCEIIRQSSGLTFGMFAYIIMYTGLRRGELLALQWKDIDFERCSISVNKSVTYAKTGNQPEIKSPKTAAGRREVVLLNRLAEKLLPFQETPDSFIFGGDRPLTQSVYRKKWLQYCTEADLLVWKEAERIRKHKKVGVLYKVPAVTPHQLRHVFATMCFEQGIDVKDTQQLMGHSKISVTMDTYTHIRKQRRDDVARKLNNAK